MKIRLLILSLLVLGNVLFAQTEYHSLVISEARLDEAHMPYIELTNVGNQTINLSDFEFGVISPWTEPYNPAKGYYMMLPDHMLAPGESYVIATVKDYTHEQWLKYPEQFDERTNKRDLEILADMQVHVPESSPVAASDSVTPNYNVMTIWGGSYCWYIEQHVTADDSVLIDQVNGVFTGTDGYLSGSANDVAGVSNASQTHILVRKFSVKTGNLDFDTGRGQDIGESEWMPLPRLLGAWEPMRKAFWTVGNHGDYNLDATTLTSDIVGVDFTNKTLTVPWGVRNNDSLMMTFNYQPGLAWHYYLSPVSEDSAYISARTGDLLTVYACGNDLDSATFTVQLQAPTADENRVLPKAGKNADGFYYDDPGPTYRVTDGLAMDTILQVPFATRTDSLLKYLEKAPDASWEIVFNGGVTRPDLIDGDLLKVTSKNGTAKNYYIQVEEYLPSHNAYLSAIMWPDLPASYYDQFGWSGDTIPGFTPSKFNYKITLPAGVTQVPAMIATTQDLNAKIKVDRATFLFGSIADRTTTFTVTAEDDTSEVIVYSVQLVPKKDVSEAQPFTTGEPFFSEIDFRQAFENTFFEICNPNGIPLDMSNYMIVRGGGGPYEVVDDYTTVDDSTLRYNRYVPGYKWSTSKLWETNLALMEPDNTGVVPIVQGGDVYVIGVTASEHWKQADIDVDFRIPPFEAEFTFTANDYGLYNEDRSILSAWYQSTFYLFKILNPELKNGTIPATNPADFEILDIFGAGDWTNWNIAGSPADQDWTYIRKPQYYKGNPVAGESFGTSPEDCEWDIVTEAKLQDEGYGWPAWREMLADDIGTHYMNDITEHLSTVGSRYYLVSGGYSQAESIKGLITGVTVDDFLADIYKAEAAQTITLVSGTTEGLELTGSDVITDQDTLIVVSANENVTTKYILFVGSVGLSDNAIPTSTLYTIDHSGNTGTISNFASGTLLSTVVANITLPEGATMSIIDANGAFVPLKTMNFDSIFVDVLATDKAYFEVTAQDGITIVTFQLQPNTSSSDAYILSYTYEIVEADKMIRFIPGGTTVSSLINNLIPAQGATIQVLDKAGFVRSTGNIYKDDVVKVTAEDGTTTSTYSFEMLEDLVYYYAYVTSKKYVVKGDAMTITGGKNINDTLLVSEFLAFLTPAPGASMTVLDKNNSAKSAGDTMAEGDQLKVVSANGINTVTYAITVAIVTEIENSILRSINVYPNPSRGIVNVDGLNNGDRIQVYSMLGVLVLDKKVTDSDRVLNIGQQRGIYIMVVRSKETTLGHYRLIVE